MPQKEKEKGEEEVVREMSRHVVDCVEAPGPRPDLCYIFLRGQRLWDVSCEDVE